MKNSGPITKVSLLLGTIICLGAFFLVDNNIPVQALHKEEQILDDYDDLAEFSNAVKNGDEEDLEEIPIQSMEASNIYDDADDSMKDCIDLAAKVGDSLTDREVVHCVDDVNYFQTKYSSNSSVSTNGTFATSTTPTDIDTDTGSDATSTSEASTSDDATSTSEASTSDDVTENNLINELVNTGKFTEAEAKEFVSKNMLSGTDAATTSGDTQTTSSADTSTDDTQTTSSADTGTDDTQTTSSADTGTDDTQTTSSADTSTDDTSSSENESTNVDSSSSNTNNPEQYGSLIQLVDDVKNGDIDTDEISLNDFQNSGAYQGADQQTQDCIDLAGKIGSNLIDYEIVRCSEDPNHFKNQIANNFANTDENNANTDENNANTDENNANTDENNANTDENNASNNNGANDDTGN
jgi:polyhydroxyalkanoate synthesis regulator phasin